MNAQRMLNSCYSSIGRGGGARFSVFFPSLLSTSFATVLCLIIFVLFLRFADVVVVFIHFVLSSMFVSYLWGFHFHPRGLQRKNQ